jgi:hypothetical protein
LKDKLAEEVEEVKDEFSALKKASKTKIPSKGMLHLASLRSHGFNLTVKEHVHLGKHIKDDKTDAIIASLKEQAATMDPCDACTLTKYMELV